MRIPKVAIKDVITNNPFDLTNRDLVLLKTSINERGSTMLFDFRNLSVVSVSDNVLCNIPVPLNHRYKPVSYYAKLLGVQTKSLDRFYELRSA